MGYIVGSIAAQKYGGTGREENVGKKQIKIKLDHNSEVQKR